MTHKDNAPVGVLVAVLFVMVCLFCLGIGLVVRQISHHIQKGNCASFARQTDREVRWIDVGFWDYDCYVKTDSGWVPRDDIFKVER